MIIRRYDDRAAEPAHAGTIRAHEVLPFGGALRTPFHSAWGYLPGPGALEPHAHAHDEIYIVFAGRGKVTVGGESAEVGNGDIVEIPSGLAHNIENLTQGELKWLAFWWDHQPA